MTDWRNFWNSKLPGFDDDDPLVQVGKTVGGVPISPSQLQKLIDDVTRNLNISSGDVILDLCCGNGFITSRVAEECERVVAVDFSERLIQLAKEHNNKPNIEYSLVDVRQLDGAGEQFQDLFDKVLMYEALAYMSEADLTVLLTNIKPLCKPNATIMFGSVLDDARKWKFFNTFRRKLIYLFKIRLLGQDPGLGKWWNRETLSRICRQLNMHCEFREQNSCLHTAHYRMDVVVSLNAETASSESASSRGQR